jgi:LysR family nitrogen assimilation transcriptional regulator
MARTPRLLDLIALLPAGDITRTAKSLGLTPDTLRKRVEALESKFGLGLLGNAAKVLKPNEAGRLVLDHASRIFSQARDLTRDLEELAGLQAPEISFGTDMFAAELPLGTALGRMATANSRLRVHVRLGDFEELVRAVMANHLEFAIADTTSAERHPSKLAIEPIAEHRVFFFARRGHPLTEAGRDLSLDTILVFPLAAPRIPQRVAGHIAKSIPHAKIDRDTGDLLPNLMVESFAVARSVVASGDAIGVAPVTAIEPDLRAERLSLIPFDAPWLHLSYGLFYPRKRSLSRAAQLFVTQLRQVETDIQVREQRALARISPGRKPRRTHKASSKTSAKGRAARAPGGRPRRRA